jgi:succinyl-diaminopimelate desuccinylase
MPSDINLAKLTLALLKIYSPSGNESVLAKYIISYLAERGVDKRFTLIQNGNTLIYVDNRKHENRLMLCAHIDTVPGELEVCREDEKLYGRGAVDTKASVAILMNLIGGGLPESAREHVVDFVFYDQEETLYSANGLGKAFLQGILPKASAAIVMEPTQSAIELGTHSSLNLKTFFYSNGGHSASLNRATNPIMDTFCFVQKLKNTLSYKSETIETLQYHYSVEPTRISSGIANNVIPKSCEALLNFRFPPSIQLKEFLKYLGDFAHESIDMEVIDYSPGSFPQLDNKAICAISKNSFPLVRVKREWSDAARLSLANIPSITFGPGDNSMAHSDTESIDISELYSANKLLIELIERICRE